VRRRNILCLVVTLTAAPMSLQAEPPPFALVFAAASLRTALDGLIGPAREATGVTVRLSYAATSALARQIEEEAPADIFISADVDWMDYVQTKGLVRDETRVDLVTNRLVLIAPSREPVTLSIGPGFRLAAALGAGRLALADPTAVPAGKYARTALSNLGVWSSVASRIAPAENVRAALLLVSRAESPLGIVYRTDAIADPNVTIVDTFPETSHPPIVYPAALTRHGGDPAARVLAFLRSDRAMAEFERQGFGRASR